MDFKIPEAIYKSSDGSGTIGTPVRFAGDSGVVVGEPGDCWLISYSAKYTELVNNVQFPLHHL